MSQCWRRQTALWVALPLVCAVVLMCPVSGLSQNGSAVRGTVKLHGSPVPGVIVVLVSTKSFERKSSQTNSAGEYEFRPLSVGDYLVTVGNTAYVFSDGIGGAFQRVEVQNTALTVLNLELTEGGVLTGCAEYASKQPVIGRQVLYEEIDSSLQGFSPMQFRLRVLTDDRGCFRVYGLPAGKYRVGIGNAPEIDPNLPQPFSTTYYPGVRLRSEAGAVKLSAAQESDLGRLVLKDELDTFFISGVFNNGYADQRLANFNFELLRYDESGVSSTTQRTTDERGQFRVEDLLAGRYSIRPVVKPEGSADYTFSPLSFEVTDKDIDDLVISCTSQTASIKGEVMINNTLLAGESDCTIALKEGDGLNLSDGRIYRIRLESGKFKLSGLTRGIYTLVVMPLRPSLQYQEAQVGRESARNGGAYGILRIDLSAGEQSVKIFLRGQ